MTPELSFHHLGIACRDLDRETNAYIDLGYARERDEFVDPIQGVKGRFLIGSGPRLELLVALEDSDVLDPWLTNGSRVYHQAYETPDLTSSLEIFVAAGARTVVEPVSAVAFDGRNICFVMLRNMSLVELIQAAN